MHDKTPHNEEGRPHGYWEVYHDGQLWYKMNYINGRFFGYYQYNWPNKKSDREFYVK